MPKNIFTDFMLTRRPPFSLQDVREVAKRFRVSHRAAALRMIDLGYAEQQVPRLLSELKGEARRQVAQAILKSLGRPLRRPERQTRPWVQELLAAAEAT